MRRALRYSYHLGTDLWARVAGEFSRADLSIFHQFSPPPGGGGHQFLRALWKEALQHSLHVENNRISKTTRACLLNSFNFDERRFLRLRRNSVLYVHRVDGPVDIYRKRDDGVDRRIWRLNRALAHKTVFQSQYSLEKHLELGLEFKNPAIIMNAADPSIFHPRGRVEFSPRRKIRLIASSWSENPQKGALVYEWLDRHLDWARYDFTFVGRSPVTFERIRMLDPLPLEPLAEILRQHDIYLTASENDPCSNSLIEAVSCGLPAIYRMSGGHREIVKDAGLSFQNVEEIPRLLETLVGEYARFQAAIRAPDLRRVAQQYFRFLELMP